MTCRSISARLGQEAEPFVEANAHLADRHGPCSSGCQLDRQRDAVEEPADLDDRGVRERVVVDARAPLLSSVDEQLERRGHARSRHRSCRAGAAAPRGPIRRGGREVRDWSPATSSTGSPCGERWSRPRRTGARAHSCRARPRHQRPGTRIRHCQGATCRAAGGRPTSRPVRPRSSRPW